MIHQINIKNFQSHKDSNLELDPGVNVIVGLSDTGKSSIIRALKWVASNRPLGDAFRSSWGGDTGVHIQTDFEQVSRIKGKGFNGYNQNTPEVHNQEFKALGAEVPEEIQKTLNISELNLQGQVDPHFLFSSSPGEVASHINRITNLDKIDTGLKSLKSSLTKTEQDLAQANKWKIDLEGQQESLKYVPILDGQLLALEQADREASQIRSKESKLRTLLIGIGSAEKAVSTRLWANAAGEWLDSLLRKQDDLRELRGKRDQISSTLASLEDLEERTESLERMAGVESKLIGLQKKIQEKKELDQRISKLESLTDNILAGLSSIQKRAVGLKKLEDQFTELMPDICPLCGQEVA